MKNGAENIIHRSVTPLCITTSKHFTGIPYSPQHPCQADKYWLPHTAGRKGGTKEIKAEADKGFH